MIAALLFVLASLFVLSAGIGLLRLSDAPSRLHASTKAASLGTAFALLAVIITFPEPGIVLLAILTLVFIFLTAPVSAHAIASRNESEKTKRQD